MKAKSTGYLLPNMKYRLLESERAMKKRSGDVRRILCSTIISIIDIVLFHIHFPADIGIGA